MAYKLYDIFKGNYPVSQYYGANKPYYAQYGFTLGHEGVDWATPVGVEILAPFDGVVIRDEDNPKSGAYGTHVVLWDPVQKCAVWWCHLVENFVQPGQSVKRGAVIGKTGNTGNSTGPHVHVNFVETDASGNRMNMNNGNKGFLNILDPKLVTWQLGEAKPSPDPVSQIDDDHRRGYEHLESYRKTRTDGPEGNFEGYARTLTDRDARYTPLTGDLSAANGELSKLKEANKILADSVNDLSLKNTELQVQIDTCTIQANQYKLEVENLKSQLANQGAQTTEETNKLTQAIQTIWDWFKKNILKDLKP